MFRKMLTATAITTAAAGTLVTGTTAHAMPANVLGPTSHIYTNTGNGIAKNCTLGFTFDGADGYAYGVTAKHCGETGQAVHAWVDQDTAGPRIGSIARSAFLDDIAMIAITTTYRVTDVIDGVGDVVGAITPDQMNRIRPVLCKTGVRTGTTCGQLIGQATPKRFRITAAADEGDSGAPVYAIMPDGRIFAAGVLSGGWDGATVVIPVTPFMSEWGLRVHPHQ